MDLAKVLAQLHAELDNLDAAIVSLERIRHGAVRRGRPPLWFDKGVEAGAKIGSLEPVEKTKTTRRRRSKRAIIT